MDDPGRIDFAYRICLGRLPTSAERERLLTYRGNLKGLDDKAVWKSMGRVLFNLDEFITRE